MKTYLYTCKHCFKEFRPTRRGVQKFCSNSCRSSHHQCNSRLEQKGKDSLCYKKESKSTKKKKKEKKKGKEKREGMSLGGVANAVAGNTLHYTVKNLFTAEHNKPATKGDLLKLANHLSRYVLIENLDPNLLGQKPYLEIETGKCVYRYDNLGLKNK